MAYRKKAAPKKKPSPPKPEKQPETRIPSKPIGFGEKPLGGTRRRFFFAFAYFYPSFYRKKIAELMKYTDLAFEPDAYLGASVVYGATASAFLSLVITLIMDFAGNTPYLLFAGLLLLSQLLSYGIIFFSADRKATFAEEMLPDALQLASSHIRSGITPDKALMLAARPEFGSLERELKQVAREAMTGTPLDEALIGIGKRIKSSLLERTMVLVSEGMKSGGELATLLEETAEDIRNAATLRREVHANVMMYIILIFLASAIGAPALFGTTTFLVESVTSMGAFAPEQTNSQLYTNAPIKFAKSEISVDFMIQFAIATIITSAIFGGLILGMIESGEIKSGIKYIPVMMTIGLIVFFVARSFLSNIFSAFMF